MKIMCVVGASVLGKSAFVERLIEAFRCDDHSVSIIKHAPDGFDMDTPGKASHARRTAGAREVMLVGDRRLVLMKEYRSEPGLAQLVARLDPVDLVIVEGFGAAPFPTIEVHRPSSGRPARWPENRHVVALASDERVISPLPCFPLDDVGPLADFMTSRMGLGGGFERHLNAGQERDAKSTVRWRDASIPQ